MPVVDMAAELTKSEHELAQARELVSVDDPELAAEARAEVGRAWGAHRRPGVAAHDGAPAARSARRAQRGRRDPRGDRWRRGGAVRRRSLPHVHALLRAAGLAHRDAVAAPTARSAAFEKSYSRLLATARTAALRWESGVHRVQRVPATEAQGRIHTSAATVAVLPEAEEVDVKIEDKDLRIDVFRSSGPGGPEREHHRLGGAHHAPAVGPRGEPAGSEVAAPEQAQGDGGASRASTRPQDQRAAAGSRANAKDRRWGAAIDRRRFARTTIRRAA